MKHKHAELIKLWADGAEIQYRVGQYSQWEDCLDTPAWKLNFQYRIKPTPRPQWQQDLIDAAKAGKVVEIQNSFGYWVKAVVNYELDNTNFTGLTQKQYRIRPEKVTRYLWAYKNSRNEWFVHGNYMTDDESKNSFPTEEIKRLDWSATEFEE